jgi:hypothetical protein
MNFSTIVSMTAGDRGPKVTIRVEAIAELRAEHLFNGLFRAVLRHLSAGCRRSARPQRDSQKPMVPALNSRDPAFDVMISTTWRKSALRPLLSVSVA